MKRTTQQRPGYDCRKVCSHDEKGDHGISGGTFWWIVRGDDPRFAFVLVLHADEYPATVEPHLQADWLARHRQVLHENIILPWPGYFGLHSTVPLDKDTIIHNDRGSGAHGCDYLDGVPCYDGGTWSGDKGLNSVIAHDGGRLLLDQPEAFWKVLEEKAAQAFTEAAGRAEETARWIRCPTCDGEQVIPRAGPAMEVLNAAQAYYSARRRPGNANVEVEVRALASLEAATGKWLAGEKGGAT